MMHSTARRIRFRYVTLSAAVLIASVVIGRADVTLPPLFADGAVLQRDRPLTVWGSAESGERVTVSFAGKGGSTVANAKGEWIVTLPATPGSIVGQDLTVTGKNRVTLRDVIVGDVWFCSGQSNMELPVSSSLDAAHEIASAHQPLIREIKIGRNLAAARTDRFNATAWRTATPEHVGEFTAVGYYFARHVIAETNVPIGLIQCSWSGTSIEPWMSAEALASRPEFAVVAERWRADLSAYPARRVAFEHSLTQWKADEANAVALGARAHEEFLKAHRQPRPPAGAPDHPYPGNPSALYNGMVFALRHASIRGVLWYQGEANAVRAREYSALFRALIGDWRQTFGQPELPFYWVQIANFSVDTDWARLREAQASALALRETGQAVTIDIGDPLNIHPANKQEAGRRLALLALTHIYHRAGEFSGPVFDHAEFSAGKAVVHFTHAAGLNSHSGRVASLELAPADHVFHAAEAEIDGEVLVVTCAAVPDPVAVRYAFAASPSANLYNVAGLPAAPFRSDSW